MRRSPSLQTALFLLLILCQSEAFASKSHSSLFGIRLRGGESSTQSKHKKLSCVMAAPPSASSSVNGGEDDRSHRNAVQRPQLSIKRAEYVAETKLPTDIGQFQLRSYNMADRDGQEPCVIYCRDKPPSSHSVPVRIHDQCLTSEVFRSQRCVFETICVMGDF